MQGTGGTRNVLRVWSSATVQSSECVFEALFRFHKACKITRRLAEFVFRCRLCTRRHKPQNDLNQATARSFVKRRVAEIADCIHIGTQADELSHIGPVGSNNGSVQHGVAA